VAAFRQLHGDCEAGGVGGQFCEVGRDDDFGVCLILGSAEDDGEIESCGIEVLRGCGGSQSQAAAEQQESQQGEAFHG